MPVPRSEVPPGPTCLTAVKQRVGDWLARRQPGLFTFLQNHVPVLKVPFARFAVVSRGSLVVESLTRDLDFTIEEINSAHMASQKGAFFLGWDRNNPQFDRERDFARACVRPDDLSVVRAIMREEADKVIAADTMVEQGISHLLVGHGSGTLPEGVLSSWDLVAFYAGR